jgi:hypothetical protein
MYTKKVQSDWQKKEIFNFENRQLRFIKNSPCFNFYGKFENNFSPFTDIDFVEYVLTFPIHELYRCKLYYDFIKKYHPELSKIRSERTPYAIYDSKYLNYLKKFLYLSKSLIEKYTSIKIPLFRTITFRGTLDWEYLFKKINFNKELKDIVIKGLNRQKIITLNDNFNNIRIKYHYLTIQNFIENYLK